MIDIRRSTHEDVPRLTAWFRSFFLHVQDSTSEPYFQGASPRDEDASAVLREALDAGELLLIAELDGAPAGFVHARAEPPFVRESPISRVGHISLCYVEPSFRRQGIAARLVEAAESWFKDQGIRYAQLSYLPSNTPAASTWPRLGYEPFRVFARKDLKPKPQEGGS